MATDKWWECLQCGEKTGTSTLHKAFSDISNNNEPLCTHCKRKKELIIRPDFALGAGSPEFVIQGISELNLEPWAFEGKAVRFDPKLVLMKDRKRGEMWIWTPYWHVVTPVNSAASPKWGQWAPMMALNDFDMLVDQLKTMNKSERSK